MYKPNMNEMREATRMLKQAKTKIGVVIKQERSRYINGREDTNISEIAVMENASRVLQEVIEELEDSMKL